MIREAIGFFSAPAPVSSLLHPLSAILLPLLPEALHKLFSISLLHPTPVLSLGDSRFHILLPVFCSKDKRSKAVWFSLFFLLSASKIFTAIQFMLTASNSIPSTSQIEPIEPGFLSRWPSSIPSPLSAFLFASRKPTETLTNTPTRIRTMSMRDT